MSLEKRKMGGIGKGVEGLKKVEEILVGFEG